MTRIQFDDDSAAFAAATRDWRAAAPIGNNVMSTVLASQMRSNTYADALWIRIEGAEGLIGAAIQTPPYSLLLTDLGPDATDALSAALTARRPTLPGVNGPDAAAERFVARWRDSIECEAKVRMRTRMFSIDTVTAPAPPPGYARLAGAADTELLLTWMRDFGDTLGTVDTWDRATLMKRLHDGRRFWLWTVADEPVAMAGASPPVLGVSRIHMVYTPESLRGHGYASALTAHVSSQLLKEGLRCMLYADVNNPTSNRIYQNIGFKALGDTVDYRFTPA